MPFTSILMPVSRLAESCQGHVLTGSIQASPKPIDHVYRFAYRIAHRLLRMYWTVRRPHRGNTPPAELTALVDALPSSAKEAVDQQLTALSNLLTKARAAVTDANTNARFWFDTVMDRTTERFVLHTRIVTVFFALALAFCAPDRLACHHQTALAASRSAGETGGDGRAGEQGSGRPDQTAGRGDAGA